MNAESTPEQRSRRRAAAGREQPSSAEDSVQSTDVIQKLRKLVEGPEPVWPIPAPDTKSVTPPQQ